MCLEHEQREFTLTKTKTVKANFPYGNALTCGLAFRVTGGLVWLHYKQ